MKEIKLIYPTNHLRRRGQQVMKARKVLEPLGCSFVKPKIAGITRRATASHFGRLAIAYLSASGYQIEEHPKPTKRVIIPDVSFLRKKYKGKILSFSNLY